MSQDHPGRPADGWSLRPATVGDLDAVVWVVAAAETTDGQRQTTTPQDLREEWARPSFDPTTDAVVVEVDGRVVAYGEQVGGRAFGHVLPALRGRGIGTAVAAWTEHHARLAGHEQVGQTIVDSASRSRALLLARGYVHRWDTWVLRMPIGGDLGPVRPPAGCVVRPARRPDEERMVYEVVEQAFGTWEDRDEGSSLEDWRASSLGDRQTRHVLVAEIDGEIVGAAVCDDEDHEGWVEQLAVRPTHMSRGIGGALLRASMRSFRDRGLPIMALVTDSRTGAVGLYERVGMRIDECFTRLTLRLHDPASGESTA